MYQSFVYEMLPSTFRQQQTDLSVALLVLRPMHEQFTCVTGSLDIRAHLWSCPQASRSPPHTPVLPQPRRVSPVVSMAPPLQASSGSAEVGC